MKCFEIQGLLMMFNKVSFCLATITMLSFTAKPISAAEAVGLAIVNGEIVVLLSDNTWRYKVAGSTNDDACISLSTQITFCDTFKEWEKATKSDPSQLAQFSYNDKNYGVLIEENIGLSDGNNLSYMREAAITNAANVIGVSNAEIVTISVEDVKFGEFDATNLIYKMEFKGLPLVYNNTIVIAKNYSYQFITYTIATGYEPIQQEIHDKFINAIKIK